MKWLNLIVISFLVGCGHSNVDPNANTYPCKTQTLQGSWNGSSGNLVFSGSCGMTSSLHPLEVLWINNGDIYSPGDVNYNATKVVGNVDFNTHVPKNGQDLPLEVCAYVIDVTATPNTMTLYCNQDAHQVITTWTRN